MPQVLVLAERAHRAIVADCLAHAATEIGGVLPGRTVGDAFVVPFSIPAGPGAKKTPVRFSPDWGWQQVFVDFLFARFRVDYLGDWHRHPGLLDQPSAHDLRTARHIVTDPGWDVRRALFPIAVIDGGEVRIRAYLMRRETLAFEEIPIAVVPDTDPRMTAVLTGTEAKLPGEVSDASTCSDGDRRGRGAVCGFLRRLKTRLRPLPRG